MLAVSTRSGVESGVEGLAGGGGGGGYNTFLQGEKWQHSVGEGGRAFSNYKQTQGWQQ